jgi:hypothetical protein
MSTSKRTNTNRHDFEPIPGSPRPPAPGSTLIGPVEDDARIRVVLLLRQRSGSPGHWDFDHWQNTPPAKREYLSPERYMEIYGANEEELRQVIGYLTSKGLRILSSSGGQRRIEAEGSAAEINETFDIRLDWYRVYKDPIPQRSKEKGGKGPQPGRKPQPQPDGKAQPQPGEKVEHIYHGFEGPASLPSNLSGIVVAVVGLDNRQLGGPANGTGDPAGANYLSPVEIMKLYHFPNTGAAGQTVGIFEAASDGAAYLHTDVTSYIASLPAGHKTPPQLTDIGLMGYFNDPLLVPFEFGGVLECTLDVSVVGAVAQGCNINVYFTENSEPGWEAFFNRAIFPAPGDNAPSVLTASWILTTADDQFTIGNPFTPGTLSNILSGYMQTAAMRGITVFMALGDWGSANQQCDGLCHVSYPNSDPWLTSCGGTIVGDIGLTPPVTFEEFVWSDAGIATSPFQGGIYEATGGGVSDTFGVPLYQDLAGILPISNNDGNMRRGLPDVAGMVGMSGFFFNGSYDPLVGNLFGTSAVSPLYAGLVAVINKFLGHSTGFINPTLYAYGNAICRDVTFGNNVSNYCFAPPPPYHAGISWDLCTGWGSIVGLRLLAALAPAPIIETAIAAGGRFADTCEGSFVDELLTINNTGFSLLLISNILSSSPDFLPPAVTVYPLAVAPGNSITIPIRFQPVTAGLVNAQISILSNALFSPHIVHVHGSGLTPRLVLLMADHGDFGKVCVGSFRDEPLLLSNSSKCMLAVNSIISSSPEFVAPEVLSFPIGIAPGGCVPAMIRFGPTAFGVKSARITVSCSDPQGSHTIMVQGTAPSGLLAVTGSNYFGGVRACCQAERTISICNVGECILHVAEVAFRRKSRYWKLVNNPFPAALHPGSCLGVVIRYIAAERCPRACELVITSDDPGLSVKTLDLLAYTIWDDCDCDDCRKGSCRKHCDPCVEDCSAIVEEEE